ncbi:hypothetical protein BpHYR1_045398 [Brachionus plicatilis]|uniref:Uncharacterized protein n=1 Tax=Brachionus plicatilis TaxID=10195 RepID=A0A3M7SL44_BRAPC|nr:hypothetical protein BpHYR1_045398 [Brachionus plicatilis]
MIFGSSSFEELEILEILTTQERRERSDLIELEIFDRHNPNKLTNSLSVEDTASGIRRGKHRPVLLLATEESIISEKMKKYCVRKFTNKLDILF